ncbi:MAG: DUF4157 domain-containing protein [Clostridia bacterium]|nr:DUF4157 domain-containing protein [Clostridia bacterium]
MNSLLHKTNPATDYLMTFRKSKVSVQPKLTVNEPGDKYEQEADAMADRVMRMSANERVKPVTGLIGASLQRKCTHCEEEEKKKKPLMRKAVNGNSGMQVSSSFASSLNASKGGGSPLPQGTKSFMENAFSTGFSSVRVHTDSQATEMSKGINAKAFTLSNDIYFRIGEYQPNSDTGKHLLAHELTHTVQQRAAPQLVGYVRQLPEVDFSTSDPSLQRQQAPQPQNTAPVPVAPLLLTVTPQAAQVTPNGTAGNQTTALSIQGAPPNSNLVIVVQPIQNSGGHDHAANRPLGRVLPTVAVADQNGNATATYTAGIVSGTERIIVTQGAAQGQCDIDVSVQNLQQLGTDPAYNLVGVTTNHQSNHFALPATNVALLAIATDFVAIPVNALPIIQQMINQLQQPPVPPGGLPVAPPIPAPQTPPLTNQQMATQLANPAAPNMQGLTLTQLQQLQLALANWPLLGYNDLSLEHGGIFDINGNWTSPHKTHRIGNTLDFRILNLNNLHRLLVQPIITRHGAQRLDEGNHWHLTF